MFSPEPQLTNIERLAEVARYDWQDPELVARLDAIAARTATWTGMPVAMVTVLLDGVQLCVGTAGVGEALAAAGESNAWVLQAGGLPAEWSLCAPMVESGHSLFISDLREDNRHRQNPVVTCLGVRGYAGVPVITGGGHVLGGHCVISPEPYQPSLTDVLALESGAAEIAALLTEFQWQSI